MLIFSIIFFVNVADDVTKSIPRYQKSPLGYLNKNNPQSFFVPPAASYEISDIIDLLKAGNSIGPSTIPIKFIKNYFSSPSLKSLMSLSSLVYFHKK